MKTIIISDIEGTANSIIPYGLRIGKHTETEVDIVHIIDPRKKQGTAGPVADSKSITPGNVLSHDRIMAREQSRASKAIHILLSREASRLHYPLKLNVITEIGNLTEQIKSLEDNNHMSIFVASTEPANTMIDDLHELIHLVEHFTCPALLVQPSSDFTIPKNVLLLNDFRDDSKENALEVIQWLKPFLSSILAFGIAEGINVLNLEMMSKAWLRKVKPFTTEPMSLRTKIISGKKSLKTLLNFSQRINPDLVVLPRYVLRSGFANRISGNSLSRFFEALDIPILIYS